MPNEENSNFSDTFFLSRNSNFSNLGDSNFFSTYGDKSMMLKQLNDMDKQIEDDNKSNFTIDLDLERQIDSLIYEEDDLKDLNDGRFYENDKSNCSISSNLLNSNNIFAFPVSIYYFNLFFSNFRKTPNFSMVCRTKKIRILVILFF